MRRSKKRVSSVWEGESGKVVVEGAFRKVASCQRDTSKNSPQAVLDGMNFICSAMQETMFRGKRKGSCRKKVAPRIRQHQAGHLATFRELYRSRDGKITVFEDEHGHITSVDSSRLV